MHSIIIGILLGWGAAVPIGPMNIEIIRRNLRIGTPFGISFGLGASSADLTYFILLSIGALAILTYPLTLKIITLLGACILFWFGISALRLQTKTHIEKGVKNKKTMSIWKHSLHGYLMTLINPTTILFWASISTQVITLAHSKSDIASLVAMGVIVGTLSWVLFLNLILFFTRHKLSPKLMRWLNSFGGIILLLFAIFNVLHILSI